MRRSSLFRIIAFAFLILLRPAIRSANAQVVTPVIPDSIPGFAWMAAASLLELSDAQELEFARLARTFARSLEERREPLLPGHPVSNPLDQSDAESLIRYFDQCRIMRDRVATDVDQVFATFSLSLDERQMTRVDRARRLVRRHAWLESLDSVFVPGIAIDLEAWMYSQYSDEFANNATPDQRAFLDAAFDRYSIAAGPLARTIARLQGETIVAARLLSSGRAARIGNIVRNPAEGLRLIESAVVDRAAELLDLNRSLIRDIASAGIAGVSDAMIDDWLTGTVPPSIGPMPEVVAAVESVVGAAPAFSRGALQEIVLRIRKDEWSHSFELQELYLTCHAASARQSTMPYRVCPETCEKMASLMVARISTLLTSVDELLERVESAADPADRAPSLESAINRLKRLRSDLRDRRADFRTASDPCTLIGRILR